MVASLIVWTIVLNFFSSARTLRLIWRAQTKRSSYSWHLISCQTRTGETVDTLGTKSLIWERKLFLIITLKILHGDSLEEILFWKAKDGRSNRNANWRTGKVEVNKPIWESSSKTLRSEIPIRSIYVKEKILINLWIRLAIIDISSVNSIQNFEVQTIRKVRTSNFELRSDRLETLK